MNNDIKEIAIGFHNWMNSLSPSQKTTVHPPPGSGAGFGIYNLSDKDLFDKYMEYRVKKAAEEENSHYKNPVFTRAAKIYLSLPEGTQISIRVKMQYPFGIKDFNLESKIHTFFLLWVVENNKHEQLIEKTNKLSY